MKSLVLIETCFMAIKSFIHTIKNMANSGPLKLQIINFISTHSVGHRSIKLRIGDTVTETMKSVYQRYRYEIL